MDRYQVSESANGPWIELVVTNNPAQALAKARASFDWPIIWVAKMRPIMGVDLLPPSEVFWADTMERMAILYGNTTVDELEPLMSEQTFEYLSTALTGALLDAEVEILAPDVKRAYGADQAVKATDFLEDGPEIQKLKRKPSLKELLG